MQEKKVQGKVSSASAPFPSVSPCLRGEDLFRKAALMPRGGTLKH
jgi:hypothetical protein